MDHDGLANFLRIRREALRPADVGLAVEGRRRTPGLRREEVAALAGISTARYERLERSRTLQPSAEMLGDLARVLRLDREEIDTFFRLAGLAGAVPESGYVEPGLMFLLEALSAMPAWVLDRELTVVEQNQLSKAVLGRCTRRPGRQSNLVWHWFTSEKTRSMGTPEQRAAVGRALVAELRALVAWHGADDTLGRLAADLAAADDEFARLWATTPVGRFEPMSLTIDHGAVGRLELYFDMVVSMSSGHRVLMLRPKLGTPTSERLQDLRLD
ncbi:helix-turn-helix transcriptional regulator [Actinoplanes sp. NBRC 103695]|uniref:helix-turn-helix transcriptional regulator n=1 Tax=Actinoplanes sp. NBRC 103695 TaxID=3032202 RepID=UPI0024A5A506|nr:helix-turn-helix transcriptional regulator [Actinoplanes sp. NBRC 103695]GLY97294.1 transcriptional regulator [Actinoplanes sp. NBRC 103695]